MKTTTTTINNNDNDNKTSPSPDVLETIDLSESGQDRYSQADTLSIKTDLTDIGPGTRRSNLKELGESVILSVSNLGENISGRVRQRLPASVEEERGWARRSLSPGRENYKVCKHRTGVSCATVVGLLLIDLLTLVILFYGYNKLRQFQEGGKEEIMELFRSSSFQTPCPCWQADRGSILRLRRRTPCHRVSEPRAGSEFFLTMST